MKYFSVFSGIGGFELGIDQAYGIRGVGNRGYDEESGSDERTTTNSEAIGRRQATCVGYSEVNKYAIQIYERHFNHKNYGDATSIDATEVPDFDLLVGGFPCQAFSVAGKRGGFNDTRGTLFFDIARILKEKQPRLCILENVKGLLSHDNGRTFKTIIAALTELGYDLQWQVLNSKNFGVPQNRERVFIVGHLRKTARPQVFPFAVNNQQHTREPGCQRITTTLTGRSAGGQNRRGNYVTRQPLKFLERNQKNVDGKYSFTVDTANTGGVRIDNQIRRLTPVECERLQGFPDGWTEGVSDTQRYKCLGNAVTVNVIREIVNKLL